MEWDVEADVVVVGGGACGLMAAVRAASFQGGVDVLLLEKDSHLMPNGELSGGLLQAAATRFQRAGGVLDDSPERHCEDVLRRNHGKGDPEVILGLCRRGADMVHWWADYMEMPIEFAPEAEWAGHTRPRMHGIPGRTGAPLIQALRERVKKMPNIRYADNTPGQGLVTDESGAIIGVLAGREGEELERIGCRRVVLAAGGFARNKEMLAKYVPEMADAQYVGSETNTGEAIRWGMELGAAVENMRGYQGHGYVIYSYNTRLYANLPAGGIVVNITGRRFDREDQGYSELAPCIRSQPQGIGIAIWDKRIHDMYSSTHHVQESIKAGAIAYAETAGEIAKRYGLPEAALQQTLAEYEREVLERRDSMGRILLASEPLKPPFYTARLTGAMAHTQGGLKVDVHGRVLRPGGTPVPNLYAGGGTAVGLSGDRPDGYMTGNGLLSAYGKGMIIAEHVVESLKSEGR